MLLFANEMDNVGLMHTLAIDFGFSTFDELKDYINADNIETPTRGRPLTSRFVRQKVYDYWLDNSEISTDRRNARHMIKIKKGKLDITVLDLIDLNISECITKRGDG